VGKSSEVNSAVLFTLELSN